MIGHAGAGWGRCLFGKAAVLGRDDDGDDDGDGVTW